MNKAKYAKVYNRNNRLDKNGKAPVNIAVYFSRNVRRFVKTGVSITPAEWNETKKIVKKHKNSIRLNYVIDSLISKIEAFELGLLNRDFEFTPATLDSYLQKGNERESSFITYGWAYIEDLKPNKAKGTINVYTSHWRAFETYNSDIKFRDVTRSFIDEFDQYLKAKKYSVSAIQGIHGLVKNVIKKAMNAEPPLIDRSPYVNLKIEIPSNSKDALTPEEFKAFLEVEPTTKRMGIVKDMFLVSAYTGVRYSDIIRMGAHFFTDDETMSFKMQKTKHDVTVPIGQLFGGKALEILNKYAGNDLYFGAYPCLTTIEKFLSDIACKAEIKKHITFHVARHTFGTTLADLSGDPFLVMSLMGHKNIKTTMGYFHDNPETRKKKILKIEWE
ncbi:MAG: site-specific integrase [Marinifilaceae bacterium]|nr:site-specific integrase [Marinifilaceae bacterium]